MCDCWYLIKGTHFIKTVKAVGDFILHGSMVHNIPLLGKPKKGPTVEVIGHAMLPDFGE